MESQDDANSSETTRLRKNGESSTPDAPPAQHRYFGLVTLKEACYLLPVLCTLTPIIILLVYAPRLSKQLSATACLPNGRFVGTVHS